MPGSNYAKLSFNLSYLIPLLLSSSFISSTVTKDYCVLISDNQ